MRLCAEALRLGADDYLLKHTCTDEELNASVQRSIYALDKSVDSQGKKQRLCQLLLQQMLTLTMSQEELNAISARVYLRISLAG
jgi:YesN/AraC family two-component response regulator